jgi:hypothetical protein
MILKTLLWGLAAATSGLAEKPAVSVQIIDDYGAPKGTKSAAQKVVDSIFGAAGVRLDWKATPVPGGFTLKLVAQKITMLGGDPLGYSFLSPPFHCKCAQLVYPEIEQVKQQWEVEASMILGAAMAHELGHLIFNSYEHSSDGIMIANFGHKQLVQASRGELLFTAEQARRIRAEIELPGTQRGPSRKASQPSD